VPISWSTVLVDRWSPSVLEEGEDLLPYGLVDRIAQRETDAALPAPGREGMAGTGGIREGEDLTIRGCSLVAAPARAPTRPLILGVIRAGVPGPQHTGQHLPPQGRGQRVEAEPAPVVAGRQLLLGMDADRGRVESRITRPGAAPAFHARSRARVRARRTRSICACPIDSSARVAVATDATFPNSEGCPASTARSETQRPRSAVITARSLSTPRAVVP
jgi:hypothetical protein